MELQIEWNHHLANDVTLSLKSLQEIICVSKFVFRRLHVNPKDNHVLFFGKYKEYRMWFSGYLDPNTKGGGYGGSTVELNMEDGTIVKQIGPWSGRAGVMNRHLPSEEWVVDLCSSLGTTRQVAELFLKKSDIVFEWKEAEWRGGREIDLHIPKDQNVL